MPLVPLDLNYQPAEGACSGQNPPLSSPRATHQEASSSAAPPQPTKGSEPTGTPRASGSLLWPDSGPSPLGTEDTFSTVVAGDAAAPLLGVDQTAMLVP